MSDGISHAEWTAELGRLEEDDEGLTVKELQELWVKCKSYVTRNLRKGLVTGRYVEGSAMREDALGRLIRVPVYKVINTETKRTIATGRGKRNRRKK